ncbi:MAG: hypothetical protein Q4G26_02670 [Paracoccus sp. (in: a-proteobacteria)]|nr:hypothetical protein [Paracoccus sp. (in: a-proteobacteria)]
MRFCVWVSVISIVVLVFMALANA